MSDILETLPVGAVVRFGKPRVGGDWEQVRPGWWQERGNPIAPFQLSTPALERFHAGEPVAVVKGE